MTELIFAGLLVIVAVALILSVIALVFGLPDWCYRLAMICGVPASIGVILIAIWEY